MKKIFTLFAAMALTVLSYAQPANGSFASDFSLYEIDKATGTMLTDHTINLYGMLNDYKTVYIDVSATTCGPCLTFHQGGTLDNIYNSYGPNSAVNDSRVLFIEGASTGSSWPASTVVPVPIIGTVPMFMEVLQNWCLIPLFLCACLRTMFPMMVLAIITHSIMIII